MSTFDVASALHIGHVRETQEDGVVVDERLGVFAVLDGMGGSSTGDLGTAAVIESFTEALAPLEVLDFGPLKWLFERAQHEMMPRIHRAWPHARGQGVECTAVSMHGPWALITHLGCTRAYVLRAGALRQLTRDHSLGQEFEDAGVAGAEPIPGAPDYSSIVTRMIIERVDPMRPQFVPWLMEPGDRLLLCSDGLHGALAPDDLREELSSDRAPGHLVDALLERALMGEARDNIAALVIDCHGPFAPLIDAPRSLEVLWGEARSAAHAPSEASWGALTRILDEARAHGPHVAGSMAEYVRKNVASWPGEVRRWTPLHWVCEMYLGNLEPHELGMCNTLCVPDGMVLGTEELGRMLYGCPWTHAVLGEDVVHAASLRMLVRDPRSAALRSLDVTLPRMMFQHTGVLRMHLRPLRDEVAHARHLTDEVRGQLMGALADRAE